VISWSENSSRRLTVRFADRCMTFVAALAAAARQPKT
jgi:hypothetical protein